MPRIRNLAARSPLLRKGGVHEKSRSGCRQRQRQRDRETLDQWFDDEIETQECTDEAIDDNR